MFVLGTAGHVDHGKSTLIQALTGIDPDRLKEEKEREMTTDLGFAWLTLPSGREVSIVDVPGHERFIKNMLAGVGGYDLAMLIVAADEGVRPQTREHLAILDLLQVRRGFIVITKSDLVEADFLDLVAAEVQEAVQGSLLADAPVFAVSAVNGQGIAGLLDALDRELDVLEPRRDLDYPRLPVDRSFIISGFGTVVTGTLTDGTLRVGQEVELVPSRKRARIRGLQTHRKKVEEAYPGTRVAVNLAGVSHEEIERGQMLTTPGWLRPTPAVDVALRMIADSPQPLRHNATVTLHSGTAETFARVRVLDNTEEVLPGASAWVQFRLEDPLPLVKGDFFVARSADATLGGGRIVDPQARRHKRGDQRVLERLEVMDQGSGQDMLLRTLEEMSPVEYRQLVQRVHLPEADARAVVEALLQQQLAMMVGAESLAPSTLLYASTAWTSLQQRAHAVLFEHHRRYPLRKGISKEELRNRLGLSAQHFPLVLRRLIVEGALAEDGAYARLPDHEPRLSSQQEQRINEYLSALRQSPYNPPTDRDLEADLLALLIDRGEVVRVSDDVVFAAEAYTRMVDAIRERTRERGRITVAEVRDLFSTSRKYALALLEYLDEQHVTRRVGDERVLA